METKPEKFILVTGATSGIGLAFVKRLSMEFKRIYQLHICIACRNMTKGNVVKDELEFRHKGVTVDLVKMDVSNVQSVKCAAEQIRHLYTRLDYVYLNAGILPVSKFHVRYALNTMFSKDVLQMFKTGLGMFTTTDETTKEGVKSIFATNVLGHFVLVNELIPVLTSQSEDHHGQVIWTTSSNASKKSFKLNDVTCQQGSQPYSSSKYAMEGVSIEMNKRLNSLGIYSHVSDPGTVKTNITKGVVAEWLWYFLIPFMWMLRLFLPNFTIYPYNACHSMVWLFQQDPEKLEDRCRYCSYTNVFNTNYIHTETLAPSRFESELIYDQVKKVSKRVCS
uniref:3-keto-steroid reductase/17-beta-hydroxysteroid dehydrogenase 7 n=1 Tax=Ciona intestinalis TaxID=7719 RepID=F6VUS5_CIOIN|nr:3-keto-steroid reductase-like [Ciona intestinalis]|eukprot:XP_002130850.1 3-keto-steroid reductase-like [Ciona intestinalis]